MSLSRLVDDEKLVVTVSDDDVLREFRSSAEEYADSAGKIIHSTRKHVRALRTHCPDIPESVPDLPPFAFGSIDEAERTCVLQKEFREKIEELRDHLARLRSALEEEVRRLERGENDKKNGEKTVSVSGNNGSKRKSNGHREEELLKRKFLTSAYEDLHRVQAAIHSLVQRLQSIPPDAVLDDDTGLEIFDVASTQRRALDSLRVFSKDAHIECGKHDRLTQWITTLHATLDVLNRLVNSGASFDDMRKSTAFPRSWDAPIPAMQASRARGESQGNGQFDESTYAALLSQLERVRANAPRRVLLNPSPSQGSSSPRLSSERVASVTQDVRDALRRFSLDASSDPGDVREQARRELHGRLLQSAREAEIRRMLVGAVDQDAERVIHLFHVLVRKKARVAGISVGGMSSGDIKQAADLMRACWGQMVHAKLEFPEMPGQDYLAQKLNLKCAELFEELIGAIKAPDPSKEELLRMYKRLIDSVLFDPDPKGSVGEAMRIGLRRMMFAEYLPYLESALECIERGGQGVPVRHVSAKQLLADCQHRHGMHISRRTHKGRIIRMP